MAAQSASVEKLVGEIICLDTTAAIAAELWIKKQFSRERGIVWLEGPRFRLADGRATYKVRCVKNGWQIWRIES